MILRLSLLLAMMATWSCSGDSGQQESVKEPVAAEQKIPDNPGESGESTKAKPPGVGQAAADASAMGQPEKSTPPSAASAAAASAKTSTVGDKVVVPSALNVRSGAGTKHPVVRSLKKGEHVTPDRCDKGWCKIADGEFVSEKFLSSP